MRAIVIVGIAMMGNSMISDRMGERLTHLQVPLCIMAVTLGAIGGLLGPYAVGWVCTATRDPSSGLLAIGLAAALGGILVQGLGCHLSQGTV